MDASKDSLQEAVDIYTSQLHLPPKERRSIRSIAEEKGVWPSSLSLRVRNGYTTQSTGSTHLQVLTPGEEHSLHGYIIRMGALGHPPPPGTVFDLAAELRIKRLIREGHDRQSIERLGSNWPGKFKKRFPDVSTVLSRSVDRSRFDGTAPERLLPWFRELKLMMDRHNYTPDNIYNMDESGYAIGTIGSHPVMVSRKYHEKGKSTKKKEEKSQPGRHVMMATVNQDV
ncbi:hypothetical protein I203_100829 [Kwoniella mangroviensis CBS 8507]|uniref:uncharacterized protein n=1 Tax=Kwoniella mangroviensis CBS 8507 TaxID=1296122 RepID=UPI00302C1C08